MDPEPQQPMDWDSALVALDGAIVVVDLAEIDYPTSQGRFRLGYYSSCYH